MLVYRLYYNNLGYTDRLFWRFILHIHTRVGPNSHTKTEPTLTRPTWSEEIEKGIWKCMTSIFNEITIFAKNFLERGCSALEMLYIFLLKLLFSHKLDREGRQKFGERKAHLAWWLMPKKFVRDLFKLHLCEGTWQLKKPSICLKKMRPQIIEKHLYCNNFMRTAIEERMYCVSFWT